MNLLFCYLIATFLCFNLISAQSISGTIQDPETKTPIPYATVQYAQNKGVITNEEGFFSIPNEAENIMEISISSMGYEPVKISINELKEIIYLKPKSIELSNVFISNRDLTVNEIIERALLRIDSNYNFNLAQRRFFFRRSYVNKLNQFNLEVEETTIPEINQQLMDEVTSKVPRYVDSYYEYLGDLYGNYDRQKIAFIKVANLENPLNEESLEELAHRFEKILQKNIGEGTFLKIKSGIIGFKLDAEELNEGIEEVNRSTSQNSEEIEKARQNKKKQSAETAISVIQNRMQNMFWKEDGKLDIFDKSRKYNFKMEGLIPLEYSIAYVISFEPRRKADFKGKIYVNTEDFGIHRLDYENVRPLKKFSLFGVNYKNDVYRGTYIFSRNETSGKYNPKYIEVEDGNTFGVKRPLELIVKKDRWLFNKKLKEVEMEVNINDSDISKFQLLVYENTAVDENTFDNVNTSADFEFKDFKEYDPDFWNGYNIMEPNSAIKAFKIIDAEVQDL